MKQENAQDKPCLPVLGPGDEFEIDRSAPGEAELKAAGWVRRHLVDRDRAKESVELYTSIGYETKIRELAAADLEPICGKCAASVCGAFVIVYTRKQE